MSSRASDRILGGDSLVKGGEHRAPSDPESGVWDTSRATRFGLGSDVAVGASGNASEGGASVLLGDTSLFPDGVSSMASGLPVVFFWSLSWASKPSTRFSKASRTSVLGPRFFGTASAIMKRNHQQPERRKLVDLARRTVDAWTLENLACLTRWA